MQRWRNLGGKALGKPIAMVTVGWVVSLFLVLSLGSFFLSSFTIGAWIIYLFLLLPVYGVMLVGWISFAWINRAGWVRVRRSLLVLGGVILVLQLLAIAASPGNCYGIKQGYDCYSNLQVWFGNAREVSFRNQPPHWKGVEDAFLGLLAAHTVAVILGLVGLGRSLVAAPHGQDAHPTEKPEKPEES